MDMELLTEKAAQIDNDNDGKGQLSGNVLSKGVWIMPNAAFKCSGNITSLLLGVAVRVDRTDYPSIELWHHQNNTIYTKVHGSERNITLNASHFSTTGPYHYNITPPLPYDDGDVLAVREPAWKSARVRLYQVDSMNEIYKLQDTGEVINKKSQDILISPITSKLITYLLIHDFIFSS